MANLNEHECLTKVTKMSDELISKLKKSNKFLELDIMAKITLKDKLFRVHWPNILNLDVLITLQSDTHYSKVDVWSLDFVDHDSGELIIDKRIEDCGIFYRDTVDEITEDIIYLARTIIKISKNPSRQEKFFIKLQEQIKINDKLRVDIDYLKYLAELQ